MIKREGCKWLDETVGSYHVIGVIGQVMPQKFYWSKPSSPNVWGADDVIVSSLNYEMGLPQWYIRLWNRFFGNELTKLTDPEYWRNK